MNYEIGNPEWAWLLIAVPVVGLLFMRSRWMDRRARKQFGASDGNAGLLSDFASLSLLTLGLALLVLACMDIRWGKTTREVPQRGLEVVFALDVSRSMLAQDAKPNRLTRAKQQIKDMLAEMAGDRVGLVVFAGEAKQAVPLTNHYHDFQQKLDSVGPESVSVGGSQLGVAIKAASEAFLNKTNDFKTMVLFTDGEDQESKPIELAKQLHADDGLRIFTVGLGDMTEGSRIPNDSDGRNRGGRFVQHEGQQVWSKLNGSILKQIATETDAAYIPAGVKRVNMGDVYHKYVANVEKSEFETAKIKALIPRFQWFAFPAFLFLWLYTWISAGSRKEKVAAVAKASRAGRRNEGLSRVSKTAAAILVLFPSVAFAQEGQLPESVAAKINAANELVRGSKTAEAIEAYNAIEESNNDHQDELNYNLASAHYRNSDVDAATVLFAETASSSNDRIASNSRYNLGNCHYAKALPLAQQQPEAAISELQLAIGHYRSALRLDRSLSDARENLERASKLIKQLKQDQEQQQQNDDQQQQDQEQQDGEQSEQNPDSKEDESQESESSENSNESESSEENESDKQGDAESESSEQKPEQQQQSSDQKDQQSKGEDGDGQQGSPPESDQNQNNSSAENKDSQQSGDNSKKSQMENDAANEEKENGPATEDKKEEGKEPPQGQLSSTNEQDPKDNVQKENGAVAQPIAPDDGMMTRQEALKLLQSVRDRDMLRRYRQKQKRRQRRVQVERDW
ncbi:vWA domain-containing protein [Mariniblastus fucicola]|uniref:von Willebrand factor type A domain protein n=1 Tax=Mariniblastus fucicola TaxID=980251 RepID=A0A5B9PJ58_9BACT|nr:VWA domain-containing protein [Mariniblastus fucicola]QEG24686.1 von Willebrand factor type A domain protein [Mariniblastus fucicola]